MSIICKINGTKLPSGSSLLSSHDSPCLPSSSCYVNAPCCEDKSYLHCSGDHVWMPVELKRLACDSLVSRMFYSLVYTLDCPVRLSSEVFEVVIVRRFFDFSHYSSIVACYDVKLPNGKFLFAVPEFLLLSQASSSSLFDSVYLCSHQGCIYVVSPYVPRIDSSDSSNLFFDSVVPDIDSPLSNDFSLREFLVSNHCSSKELYDSLTRPYYDNLARLVEMVLQPARSALCCPIYVTSGFRTEAVNRAVGGSSRSYHLYGRAADVYIPFSCSFNTSDLYDVLQDLPHIELRHYPSFVHVSL